MSKFVIPKKINILGHRIKVIICPKDDDGLESCGTFDPKTDTMFIWDGLSHQAQITVFFHEILEAVNWYTDLELTHIQIGSLGGILYQVFMDSKLLKEE